MEDFDREIAEAIRSERMRQESHIELIASENFTSPRVMEAMGSVLTNKYAEGYPYRRYYGGCEFVDRVEQLAIDRVKQLFGAEHANVQPHSGSQANLSVYTAILQPKDRILAMSLSHGGHLTHGYEKNLSGMLYSISSYGTLGMTGIIDYDAMEQIAAREKPKLVIVGASAYPRTIDFERAAHIAHSNGALIMADMAHIAGLVAAGLHPSPVPHCDFVTSTTHKTLRGPRGGFILCREKFAKVIDSSVFPGNQGGPLMHTIAAKAICFLEAMQPEFVEYQRQVIGNAQILANALERLGFAITSGGTDNHLMLVDLRKNFPDMGGREAQIILESANITTNRNTVPGESRSAFQTSGLRLGTAAVTTRGMGGEDMEKIAQWIHFLLSRGGDGEIVAAVRKEIIGHCKAYPLPYADLHHGTE
ncbi:MAG: serine hydroxymethyltransferase [Puniceicoccales bacterium]|jgi:glycine hydroxymethyltransferase|nr:serine hydroxymethyltransferase [Puniceicoccales bacterium]